MLTKSTILFAILGSIIAIAAPGANYLDDNNKHKNNPYFLLKFPNPDDSFLTTGKLPYNAFWDGQKGSDIKIFADKPDGSFMSVTHGDSEVFGLVGNLIFHIKRDSGSNSKVRDIPCSIEGKIDEGTIPEFTIMKGDRYLSPCGNNKGVTLHCGEYEGGTQSIC